MFPEKSRLSAAKRFRSDPTVIPPRLYVLKYLFQQNAHQKRQDGGGDGPADLEKHIPPHLHGGAFKGKSVRVQGDDIHFFPFSVRRDDFEIIVEFQRAQNFFKFFLRIFFLRRKLIEKVGGRDKTSVPLPSRGKTPPASLRFLFC